MWTSVKLLGSQIYSVNFVLEKDTQDSIPVLEAGCTATVQAEKPTPAGHGYQIPILHKSKSHRGPREPKT